MSSQFNERLLDAEQQQSSSDVMASQSISPPHHQYASAHYAGGGSYMPDPASPPLYLPAEQPLSAGTTYYNLQPAQQQQQQQHAGMAVAMYGSAAPAPAAYPAAYPHSAYVPAFYHAAASSSAPASGAYRSQQDLVRIPRILTPFSCSHDRRYPSEYPVFLNAAVGSYLSSAEWSSSIAAINSALQWSPAAVLTSACCAIVLGLVLFVPLMMSLSGNNSLYPLMVGRWMLTALTLIGFCALQRFLKRRATVRMEQAVRRESARYESAEPAQREGRLPCALRIEQAMDLVISAVPGIAAPQQMQMQMPVMQQQQQPYHLAAVQHPAPQAYHLPPPPQPSVSAPPNYFSQ